MRPTTEEKPASFDLLDGGDNTMSLQTARRGSGRRLASLRKVAGHFLSSSPIVGVDRPVPPTSLFRYSCEEIRDCCSDYMPYAGWQLTGAPPTKSSFRPSRQPKGKHDFSE